MPVKDPKDELHETRLYKTLASLSPDFAGRIDVFVGKIAPSLLPLFSIFPITPAMTHIMDIVYSAESSRLLRQTASNLALRAP